MEYRDYLQLLSELTQELTQLSEIGQQKVQAVSSHDLDALNECIKQEQAVSLTLRGIEQKRKKILTELGFENVPLREMSMRCPTECQQETTQLVENLLRIYTVLKSVQTPARTLMERELRAINTELETRGVLSETKENYQSSPTAKPGNLRTDFRA